MAYPSRRQQPRPRSMASQLITTRRSSRPKPTPYSCRAADEKARRSHAGGLLKSIKLARERTLPAVAKKMGECATGSRLLTSNAWPGAD